MALPQAQSLQFLAAATDAALGLAVATSHVRGSPHTAASGATDGGAVSGAAAEAQQASRDVFPCAAGAPLYVLSLVHGLLERTFFWLAYLARASWRLDIGAASVLQLLRRPIEDVGRLQRFYALAADATVTVVSLPPASAVPLWAPGVSQEVRSMMRTFRFAFDHVTIRSHRKLPMCHPCVTTGEHARAWMMWDATHAGLLLSEHSHTCPTTAWDLSTHISVHKVDMQVVERPSLEVVPFRSTGGGRCRAHDG